MEYPQLLTSVISSSLVMDPGSFTTKIGFSDSPFPTSDFLSAMTESNELYELAPMKSQTSALFYVQNGEFTSNEQIQQFLMNVNRLYPFEDQPIIVTLPYYTPREQKLYMSELLFEKFNAPALYFYDAEASSAAAQGVINGVTVDLGFGKTSVSTIVDGRVLKNGSSCLGINGELFLSCINYGEQKKNTAQYARDIETRHDIFQQLARLPDDTEFAENETTLPDGTILKTDVPRCVDAFFNPAKYEISQSSESLEYTIHQAIVGQPDFVQSACLQAVLPVGGLSNIPNFGPRLKQEVEEICGIEGKVKVLQLNNGLTKKQHASFLGGSILGSLSVFGYMWVSRGEWQEFGEPIMERRGVI